VSANTSATFEVFKLAPEDMPAPLEGMAHDPEDVQAAPDEMAGTPEEATATTANADYVAGTPDDVADPSGDRQAGIGLPLSAL
jgi:hypothetical protein